jgi:3-hydroxyisobutyryl-CoA hydrolase
VGAGAGLSINTPFRIATENTMFAMPETIIGLFPDVGATFYFPRLDGQIGTYLGMTGQAIKAHDVL